MKEIPLTQVDRMARSTPRDLNTLADDQLFKVARDPKAPRRMEALHLLISRCSSFIRRKEIAADVEALLATTPANND